MSDIEGKHGVLELGDSRLVGTVVRHEEYFDFRIDGTRGPNTLDPTADWNFTPDPEPMPKGPGFYRDGVGDLWHLDSIGTWRFIAPASDGSSCYLGGPVSAEIASANGPFTLVAATA